jgi:hypothetical protein
MELLRYAPHLSMENIKVNKFMFGLKFNMRAKVRILMPQTLNDVVQKALIEKKELTSGGHRRTLSRPTGHTTVGVQQHHKPAKHQSGYRDTLRGSTFTMTDDSVEDSL